MTDLLIHVETMGNYCLTKCRYYTCEYCTLFKENLISNEEYNKCHRCEGCLQQEMIDLDKNKARMIIMSIISESIDNLLFSREVYEGGTPLCYIKDSIEKGYISVEEINHMLIEKFKKGLDTEK